MQPTIARPNRPQLHLHQHTRATVQMHADYPPPPPHKRLKLLITEPTQEKKILHM